MEAVQQLVLSVIVTLTAAFNQGLEQLNQKAYEPAIAAFSQVIDSDAAVNPLRPLALYYRAAAHEGKGNQELALADLTTLLRLPNLEKPLAAEAYAAFTRLAGKPEALLPAADANDVYNQLVARCGENKLAEALALCTPAYQAYRVDPLGSAEAWGKMVMEQLNGITVVWRDQQRLVDRGTATLIVANQQERIYRVNFVQRGDRWLIEDIMPLEQSSGPEVTQVKLRRLGLMLLTYASDHEGAFPPTFDKLVADGYAQARDTVWADPAGGEAKPYLYCAGLTDEQAEKLIAAAPATVAGKRLVLRVNGQVESLPEETFAAQARAQEWLAPAVAAAAGKLDDAATAHIKQLVEQLGAKDFPTRQQALIRLRELGEGAYPVLKEYVKHDDPEIRLTVRELLPE